MSARCLRRFGMGLSVAAAFAFAPISHGADPQSPPVEYKAHIVPLLEKYCVACHGPKLQEGELRLDSFDNIQLGGKRGPAVVPGKSAESPLIRALRGEGRFRQMPPEPPEPTAKEVALLIQWIDAGAVGPK
jgi:hypothetical protein